MARDWGRGRREEFDEDPAAVGGSPEVDLLIKAAVASVSFEPVRDALLDACFGDPNLFDDMYWDASQALAVQHALEPKHDSCHQGRRAVTRATGGRVLSRVLDLGAVSCPPRLPTCVGAACGR